MSARVFRIGYRFVAASSTLAILGMFSACSAAGDSGGEVVPGGTGGAPEGGTGGTGASTGGTGGVIGTGGTSAGGDGGGGAGGEVDGGAGAGGDAGGDASAGSGGGPGGNGGAGGLDAGFDGDVACSLIPEVCDGLDNNCDGSIDENNPGGGQPCDTGNPGICGAGTTQCVNGAIQCVQDANPNVEICDGLDNNCDGNVDEGDPGGGAQCNTGQPGQCQYGIMHCVLGQAECQQLNSPQGEVCNGLDDNCDGSIDEGSLPGVGTSCLVPGQPPNTPCAQSFSACVGGQVTCPQTYTAQSEICNGVDDDCNTTIDDPGSVNGLPCDTGLPGICRDGTSLCITGTPSCNPLIQPFDEPEICDGLDNDCDNQTDEMNPNTACTTQLPGAQYVASWSCTGGNCEIASCQSDHFDINGAPSDGCECSMTGFGSSCAAAVAVPVPHPTALASPISQTGGIPTANGSAWLRAEFARPTPVGQPWHFRVALTDAHSGEFVMQVFENCSGDYADCSDGANGGQNMGPNGIWEVSALPEGTAGGIGYGSSPTNQASTVPPTVVYIQITRATPATTCSTFEVRFYNYTT